VCTATTRVVATADVRMAKSVVHSGVTLAATLAIVFWPSAPSPPASYRGSAGLATD